MPTPPHASTPRLDPEQTAQLGTAITEPGKPSATNRGGAGGRPADEPSVTSSLEHLLAGTQGVIGKRIDLALLEGREMLSRTVQGAALVVLGTLLAAATWFALAASAVLLVFPVASWVVRLAAFGLLNAGGALGLVALAMRRVRRETRVRPNGNDSRPSSTVETPSGGRE